jgi:ectoine hydroxylase-related dioxygenase (phytanoyl-CoA dioxygenase family)
MKVEDFAALLGKLKPAFIHHPTSKELVRGIMEDLGADPARTYFDVPKMRSSTSDDYLTTGIALAFPPHRDTWYSAPHCQINWWMPIYPITPDNGMAFYPYYFDRPIKNNSEVYNYYKWNKTRATAHLHVGGQNAARIAPEAQEPVGHVPDARYITAPGGLILFSGAQLHASLPNRSGRTRFSIDFRTVNCDDVAAQRGAANVDSACTGTALRDFLRGTDHARLPEELVRPYDSGEVDEDALLVYQPDLRA